MAPTANPVTGPASTRGSAKRLESRAYCVAENRFSVRRSSSTENAPLPIPDVSISKPVAAYIAGALGPSRTRQCVVAQVGEELQEPERPQRVAQAGQHVAQPPTNEPATNPTTLMVVSARPRSSGTVAHVHEERARQRLRQLVGELVEHDERQDLERPRAGEEAQNGCQTASRSVRGGATGTSGSGERHVTTSIGR